jgi:ribosomal protein S18 acetylase RimI-like enzyme
MTFKYKLPRGYSIEEIESDKFAKLWAKPAKRFFNDKSLFYDRRLVHSKKEQAQFRALNETFNSKQHLKINLALYYQGKFVGWSWGYQETATVFYMCNSAVLENHRNKGLYTCLMREMLKRATELGFAKIYSRHIMTNNDILIAKLKQGFKVTSFELSDTFGTMVHLSYYPSKLKNEILDFRSGYRRPNRKLKKVFRL